MTVMLGFGSLRKAAWENTCSLESPLQPPSDPAQQRRFEGFIVTSHPTDQPNVIVARIVSLVAWTALPQALSTRT